MTTGLVQDHNLEKQMQKQMGCMSGFLHIFDRHQLLNGKRIYSTKRLTPAVDSSSESGTASPSPAVSKELSKPEKTRSAPSPDRSTKQYPMYQIQSPEAKAPAENPTKSPLPLSGFEFKEGSRSSWKFSREAPRLSLDSRAVVDAKGSLCPREIRTSAENCADGCGEETEKQRRSTSVIARLMGLEPLAQPDPEPVKKSELRRSASESRVSKDLFPNSFVGGDDFRRKQESQSRFATNISDQAIYTKPEYSVRNARPEPAKSQTRSLAQRKSFFDSQDVFPEPKQSASIYGEIERRLKKRGIDEPSKDLETLKQILEALQLKGLLHSGKAPNQCSTQRNIVRDRSYESPIVLMRPGRSPSPAPRFGNDSPPPGYGARTGPRRNNLNQTTETASPRVHRTGIDRNVRSQSRDRSPSSSARNENSIKSPGRRKPLSIETQRKVMSDSPEQRRSSLSPAQSPKLSPRRSPRDQPAANRSPRNRKPTAKIHREEDELSSVSGSSISTPSQTDTERSKDGRSLLERCDKLLLSIAEITSTELQPSPVSVLDSSFYKEDSSSSSPSPVKKRSIDFKEQSIEFDDEIWSPEVSFPEENSDSDFVYISDIFRASSHVPEDSDLFLVLEKQQCRKGKDTSKASRIHRKLIFDTVIEILDRQSLLPPWKAVSGEYPATLQQTWSEFRRIRERDTCEEDLFELICGLLRKDLAGDAVAGWGDFPIEMSEAVLDIERLIFKDLIGETIGDLASLAVNRRDLPAAALRRKLVF